MLQNFTKNYEILEKNLKFNKNLWIFMKFYKKLWLFMKFYKMSTLVALSLNIRSTIQMVHSKVGS
jgi:hypothetical protein